MAAGKEIERLIVRLVGDSTQYTRMWQKALVQTNRAVKQIQRLGARLDAVGKKMGQLGRSLSLRLTAPLVAMGMAATVAFGQFDKAMVESTSIMKVTAAQTEEMRDLAISLSGEAAQGPAELAKSYYYLASAGMGAEASMAALPQMAKFATAGAFDMARATDLATDAQSALGLAVKGDATANLKNLTRVTDVLVKANTLANASVEQFSTALTSKAGASLRSYNKDIEEGVAVLAAFADQGIKESLAGESLSRIMLLLSKSSRDAAKEHERLGFKVFDATGKMRNFADIVENLETITAGMSDEVKSATLEALGFEARVQAAVLPLLGTSEAIREYEKELRKAGGTTDEVARKQMQSFANKMKLLKNQMTAMAVEFGAAMVPAIEGVAEAIKGAVVWFRSLSPELKALIGYTGAFAAALGPVLVVLGLLTSVAGQAAIGVKALYTAFVWLSAHPIVAVLVAIGAAVAYIATEMMAANRIAREGLELGAKVGEQQKKMFAEMDQNMEALGDLAAREKLSNEEKERARNLIADLEAYYGPLSVRIDEATGAIEGFTKASKEAREAKLRLREVQIAAEMAEVKAQFAGAVEMMDDYFRSHEYWGGMAEAASTKLMGLRQEMEKVQAAMRGEPVAQGKPGAKGGTGGTGAAGLGGAKKATDDLQQSVDSLTASLRGEVDVLLVGADRAKLLALEMRGATEEQLKGARLAMKQRDELRAAQDAAKKAADDRKKVLEEGKRLIERHLTPQERMLKLEADLDRLLKAKAIDQKTYNRALAGARKELEGMKSKKLSVDVTLGGEGLKSGSYEARIAALQHYMKNKVKAPTGPGKAQSAIDSLLASGRQFSGEVPNRRWNVSQYEGPLIGGTEPNAVKDAIATRLDKLITLAERQFSDGIKLQDLDEAGLEG